MTILRHSKIAVTMHNFSHVSSASTKEALKNVVLPDGVVGEVIPASTLVEQCFSLVAGKIDPGYGCIGGRPRAFIMGIKNQLDEENTFFPDRDVANISFRDLRWTKRLRTPWSAKEKETFEDRERAIRKIRADDDGILCDE